MNYLKLLKGFILNILNLIRKNWIPVLIIGIVIFLCFSGIIFDNILDGIKVKKYEKTIKKYEKQLKTIKNEKEELEELLNNKPITKENLKNISCEDKDKIIIKQDDIIKQQEVVINDLNNDLVDCKNYLKGKKNFGFSVYSMVGISNLNNYLEDQKIDIDLMIGVDLHHYFLKDRISFDYGLYVKPYETVGFGGKIGLTIRF